MNKTKIYLTAGLTVLFCAAGSAFASADEYVENLNFSNTVSITYSGTTATINSSVSSGVSISQSGADLSITSTVDNVEYLLSGSSSSGSLKISGSPACKITLSELTLTATNNPAITILSTNNCYIVLDDETINTLADGDSYADDLSGSIYTEGPAIFSGTGALTLNSRGPKHGLYSLSDIYIRSGDITINGASKDAIHGGGLFQMDSGTVHLKADGDGIDVDEIILNGGDLKIVSTEDDSDGLKSGGDITIDGGNLNITVQGDASKGINCDDDLEMNRGNIAINLSGNVVLETVTGDTFTYTDPSYCTGISCDDKLTLNDGTIIITHSGTAGKAISIDGNLKILGGRVDLTVTGDSSDSFTNEDNELDVASADCLKADGKITLTGGTITLLASGEAGDGMTAGGELVIGTEGSTEGPVLTVATRGQRVYLSNDDYSNPKAIKGEGNVTVHGGHIVATTLNDGGEGLESKDTLTINGGTIEIEAYDDCLNASSNITVNGGSIYCYSSGNDGIDSNGSFEFNGGIILSSGTTSPEEGFDCDQNTFAINGGILIGTGGGSSTPTSSASSQRSILYTGTGTEDLILQLRTSSEDLIVYKIPRSYSSTTSIGGRPGQPGTSTGGMVMLLSSPDIEGGTSYSIVTGGTISGGTEFHGYYTNATVSGGTTAKSFTSSSSSMVTTVN